MMQQTTEAPVAPVTAAPTDSFRQYSEHLEKQPEWVKSLHIGLRYLWRGVLALAAITWLLGLFATFQWLRTGVLTGLDTAWLNYGFSMSLLALPIGLDTLLLRAHPTYITGDSPFKFRTGFWPVLAGLGITAGGMPGLIYWLGVISSALSL